VDLGAILKNRFIPQTLLFKSKREAIILKKTLTYLLILLAVCSLSLPLIPTAQSQAESIKVLNYTYYFDSLGLIVVVGEIQNQGPNNINGTVLTGTITGSDGGQVYSYRDVWGTYLTPQQKAPFYLEFQPQTQSGTYITEVTNIEIAVYQAHATAYYQYPDLKVASSQSYIGTYPGKPATANELSDGDLGVFWVSGTLENTGTQTATNVIVYGTFYNANGETVAVGYSETNTTIAAGVVSNFKLGAFDLNQSVVPADKKISTYSLLIQTHGPFIEGNAPVAVATPTPPPMTSTTPAPGGETGVDSDGSIPTWVYGVIVAVAVVAVAAALIFVRRRSNKPRKGSKYH
jgi:hypothetical protein